MKKNKLPFLLLCLVALLGCNKSANQDPATYINTNLGLPAGSFSANIDTFSTDNTITLSGSGGSSVTPINGGQTISVSIPFSAPNGNVVGGAIRFGDNGPINIVPISGASGNTSGMLNFNVTIPADICDNLSSICHQIKCYEYAVTSIGKLSRANINNVAILCGDCDEPSCAGLVDCSSSGGQFIIINGTRTDLLGGLYGDEDDGSCRLRRSAFGPTSSTSFALGTFILSSTSGDFGSSARNFIIYDDLATICGTSSQCMLNIYLVSNSHNLHSKANGTAKIESDNSITFSGNFDEYDDSDNFVRTVAVSGRLKLYSN